MSACCASTVTCASTRSITSTPRARHVPRTRRRHGARLVLRAAQRRVDAGARTHAAAPGARARRTDIGDQLLARPVGAVLDEPRLRVPRRRLRGQHRLRAPPTATGSTVPGVVDVGDCVAGAQHLAAHRPGGSGAAVHPRRQRGRVRRAVRDDVSRRVPGGREPVRHRRPRGAVRRPAQVRGALRRTVRDRPRRCTSGRRCTSSITCVAPCCCSRASTIRSCPRTRRR